MNTTESDRILNLPILKGRISQQSPLYELLNEKSELVFRAHHILQSLVSCDTHIHDTIVEECIKETCPDQFRNTLAKYHVASIFLDNGCSINEIELPGKKENKKTDIKCEYESKTLLVEVKHINKTPYEEEIEERALNAGESSYELPSRKGNLIYLPCDDASISSETTHSQEISKFYDYLKRAEHQIEGSQQDSKVEAIGVAAFVVSSDLFNEVELRIAFRHYLNSKSITAAMYIRYSTVRRMFLDERHAPTEIVSLSRKVNNTSR